MNTIFKRGTHNNTQRFPLITLLISIFITTYTLIMFAMSTYTTINYMQYDVPRTYRAIELRGVILYLDAVLTMSARRHAFTGEKKWEEQYIINERTLNLAINETASILSNTLPSLPAIAPKQTEEANFKLVAIERRAFDLVKQGKSEQAQSLLFSPEYENQKLIYYNGMRKYDDSIRKAIQVQLQNQKTQATYIFAYIIAALLFSILSWIVFYHDIVKWKLSLQHTTKKNGTAKK